MDLRPFLEQFHDYLAPKLDVYEQAIYLYLIRHSRLLGQEEVTIGFKSARTRMACGVGTDGTPMSEATAYKKLSSLQSKRCIKIVQTEHVGRRMKVFLPNEIPGVIPEPIPAEQIDLEAMDFFAVPENRKLILEREGYRCFYTLKFLDESTAVLDHVVSRPEGDNSYRNVVAASREANNQKGRDPADVFLRRLYRDGFLSDDEFRDRLEVLGRLKRGELKPPRLGSAKGLEQTVNLRRAVR